MQELLDHYLMKKNNEVKKAKNPNPKPMKNTMPLRIAAKRLMDSENLSAYAVADRLGVPRPTMRRWRDEGVLDNL